MRRLLIAMLALLLVAAAAPTAFADQGNDTTTINIQFLGNTIMGTFVEQYSFAKPSASLQMAAGARSRPGGHAAPLSASLQTPSLAEQSACANIFPVQITDETWTFTGQVNGKPASSSGTWVGVWDGASYVGNITQITAWSMGTLNEVSVAGQVIYPAGAPVFKPKTPIAASIKGGDSKSAWLVLGLRKLGEMSFPLAVQGGGYDPGSGKVAPPCQGPRTFSVTNVAGQQEIRGLPRTGEAPGGLDVLAFAALALGAGALFASRRLWRRPG